MKRMKKYELNIVIIFVLTILLCVFTGCSSKKSPNIRTSGGSTGLPEAGSSKEEETGELPTLYIYEGIDEDMQIMLFIRIGKNYKEFLYSYDASTTYTDKYDEKKSINDLIQGNVYELDIKESKQYIKSIQESKDIWEYADVENYKTDWEKDMFTVGRTNYMLTSEVPVFDGDCLFTREQIAEKDILTLYGYGTTIVSVVIDTGHGQIMFTDTERFEGGYFVLGNVAAAKIEEKQIIPVRAGTFVLKVAGNGMGGSKEITIESGETCVVSLKEFITQIELVSSVSFVVEDGETVITINGKRIDYSEPVKLKYGTYRVKAKRKGYDDWSRLLLVNSKSATVEIEMKKTIAGNSSSSSGNARKNNNPLNGYTKNNNSGGEDSKKNSQSGEDTELVENSLINEIVDLITGN